VVGCGDRQIWEAALYREHSASAYLSSGRYRSRRLMLDSSTDEWTSARKSEASKVGVARHDLTRIRLEYGKVRR
jgi:hypothetical protein